MTQPSNEQRVSDRVYALRTSLTGLMPDGRGVGYLVQRAASG